MRDDSYTATIRSWANYVTPWVAVIDIDAPCLTTGYQLEDYDWNPATGIATIMYSHPINGNRTVRREQLRWWTKQGEE